MPDIFLSYSREDQAAARRVAEALQHEGYEVWWDQALAAGDAYDRITEQALESARAVVVLWSHTSVESRWVRAEATTADRLGTLVPVMIEPCKRPIMFELTQSADLSAWKGDRADPAWQGLLASLRRFLQRDPQAGPASARVSAPPAPPARPSRTVIAAGTLVILLLAGLAAWLLRGRGAPEAAAVPAAGNPAATAAATARPAEARPSIAVLPFRNLSSDPEQEYFSDGLTEELQNELARLPGLRVIARTSSFAFKGQDADLRQISQALGVGNILEGSVRKAGDRVRVSAQLVDPADGSQRWSQTWERKLDDIFAIQQEIARAVADQLKVTLGGARAADRGTNNVAAYDAYLAGVGLSYRGGAWDQSIRQLEHAVALDPDYLQARMALIQAYLGAVATTPAQRVAAARARDTQLGEVISRAPDSALATLARAYQASDRRDLVEAMRQYARYGEQAGPEALNRVFGYGQLLIGLGQVRRGVEQLEATRSLDPLNGVTVINLLVAYESTGENARADALAGEILSMPSADPSIVLGSNLVRAMGNGDRAAIRATAALASKDPLGALFNAPMLEHLDDPQGALRILRRLIDDPRLKDNIFALGAISQWSAFMGDKALSQQALDGLVATGVPLPAWAVSLWRPVIREVRTEPGFRRMLRELGVVDYWRATGNWGDFCQPAGRDDFTCR